MFNRRLSRCPPAALTLLALLALPGAGPGILAFDPLWAQGSAAPATAVFSDFATDRVRSDNQGPYLDASGPQNCGYCSVDRRGFFFLRTTRLLPGNAVCWTGRRITLDFSDPVGSPPAVCTWPDAFNPGTPELNICGSNAIPEVRLIAGNLFQSNAGSTAVSLPFDMAPNFQGGASFSLEFASVGISGSGSTRVLTATGASAVAELFRYSLQGRKTVTSSLGRFSMPFQLTVTRLQ